jgi:hypothetical protein
MPTSLRIAGAQSPAQIKRAEAKRLGIRSLMRLMPAFALPINSPLKYNVNSCRFRAKMTLLDNLVAHQSAL